MEHDDYFDRIIDRKNTFSAKWDETIEKYGSDIIPLSVADMDLPAPRQIINTLGKCNNGIYGYTVLGKDYKKIVADWFDKQYHFKVAQQHIVYCPRIIQAIAIYIRCCSKENDGIGIFTPSYSPVMNSITLNKRKTVACPLVYENNQYHIDNDLLEACFRKIKIFILISPHNPTGIVWSDEQVQLITRLAEQYGVAIISDDVHADFTFSGQHTVISTLSDYVAQNSMICTSPAKSFNIPGLEISNVVIENNSARLAFEHELLALGFHNPSYFSVQALVQAYTECDSWLKALLAYIEGNKALVKTFFAENLPGLRVLESDGTYLLWVNFSQIHLDSTAFRQIINRDAGLEFAWGEDFGEGNEGFFRMNVALPRSILADCLEKMKIALQYKL